MLIIGLGPFLFDRDFHQYDWSETLGYTAMVLGLVAVFFGIRHYRDQHSDGTISFGRAVGVGLLISTVAALLFVVADGFYVAVLDPDFMTKWPELQIAKLQARNAPAEEIQKIKDTAAMMQGPGGIAILEVIMFSTVFLIGTCITLISALVLKRRTAQA